VSGKSGKELKEDGSDELKEATGGDEWREGSKRYDSKLRRNDVDIARHRGW